MTDEMKDLLARQQLDGVVKLLGGTLKSYFCQDSSGKKYKKWVIEYEKNLRLL
jgi:hypothetical protein